MSRMSRNVINWRKKAKNKLVQAMGGQCQVCSYDKCQNALEFHHINPEEKELSFGRFRANPIAIEKIIQELKKCILVCANCHREIHEGITCVPENFKTFDQDIYNSLVFVRTKKVKIPRTKKVKIPKKKQDKRKMLLTNQEVFDILHEEFRGNKTEMARHYGVSETTIRKRLKQITSPSRCQK